MMSIPLNAVPNQSLSVILDNNNWGITLKTIDYATIVSLTLNGTDITWMVPVRLPEPLIIPAQYEEQDSGNFFFSTANLQIPFYNQFGLTQSLLYASASELTTFRQPPPNPITAAYFNPIAALPLRFAPTGYQ